MFIYLRAVGATKPIPSGDRFCVCLHIGSYRMLKQKAPFRYMKTTIGVIMDLFLITAVVMVISISTKGLF